MERSNDDGSEGLTARVLPAVYLFIVSVISGVIIGHAIVTVFYHPTALGWVDALAIPVLIAGCIAWKAHLRALEEHTEEEYLENLRRGFSAYVIYFIALASLISGLVSGGIAGIDNADQRKAEEEANESIAASKIPMKIFSKLKDRAVAQPVTEQKTESVTSASFETEPLQLVLKSIIGDSNRRTALINNIVIGEGQSSPIKADGVSYQVKCLKIEATKVTLEIEGRTNAVILTL
ncbi:MAG: hypothetical protein K0Q55_1118 [Verrucomicrobia bacterium]|jgi:hypothetical protein|nr:hypothetical protein [Verrucomicrobiota bacterium]